MIDLKQLRESTDSIRATLLTRNPDLAAPLDRIRDLDSQRRALLQRVESLKAERNAASHDVAALKKTGQEDPGLLDRLKELSSTIKTLDQDQRTIEDGLEEALLRIPNVPLDDVPVGDASANTILRTVGSPPEFDFDPAPHWELGAQLGVLDLPRGAKITGSGFPVYTGMGARLVRGLINLMFDIHVSEHGYTEVWPPALVNEASALGTGQLPDLENQMYVTEGSLFLVPTAEVPVTNLHRGEILDEARLPMAYVAYSPCFRREAGAHGKDTRGITRIHQFDKVELVRFCAPEDSIAEHERLVSHVETVLQRLHLPYRIVSLATGDLGFASAKTYDVEVWASGVGAWLEASSASTFTDFQARRANIRYRSSRVGKPLFVHTLNASGLALPRTIIALLENNQRRDGSVSIPEALVPYVGTKLFKPVGA